DGGTAAPTVPEAESSSPVVWVAIGADETDETDGEGLEDEERLRSSWTRLVFREALPRRAVHVNLASADASAADALDRQVPSALEVEPTLVAVWLTSGDIEEATPPERYERDLGAVVGALRHDGARVLLANAPRSTTSRPYNEAVARVAEAEGADLVDLSDVDFSRTVAGHRRVADAFAAVLGDLP
ncbi:MAG: GDSL-type esterase/lipase family protein, partial [Actinomycetota bacterium]|nr:GDSL-type esterase/lipase family protein [Actinomycetota bacterium]